METVIIRAKHSHRGLASRAPGALDSGCKFLAFLRIPAGRWAHHPRLYCRQRFLESMVFRRPLVACSVPHSLEVGSGPHVPPHRRTIHVVGASTCCLLLLAGFMNMELEMSMLVGTVAHLVSASDSRTTAGMQGFTVDISEELYPCASDFLEKLSSFVVLYGIWKLIGCFCCYLGSQRLCSQVQRQRRLLGHESRPRWPWVRQPLPV